MIVELWYQHNVRSKDSYLAVCLRVDIFLPVFSSSFTFQDIVPIRRAPVQCKDVAVQVALKSKCSCEGLCAFACRYLLRCLVVAIEDPC